MRPDASVCLGMKTSTKRRRGRMKASEAECQQLGTLPFHSPASASGLLEWLQTAKLLKPESSCDALCPCESLATKAGGLASQNSIWWVTAVGNMLGQVGGC